MCDSLRVCRNPVVLLTSQEDNLGLQARKYTNTEVDTLL